MKTAIKIYYYYYNIITRIPGVVHDARCSYSVIETATVYYYYYYYCIISCACIAECCGSEELEAHYFVKSGHVFVENVENLLFAPYLFEKYRVASIYYYIV